MESGSKEIGRKLLKPKEIGLKSYLLLWLITIVLPLVFLKVGILVYIHDTVPLRTRETIEQCKQVMRQLNDNCSANSYIQNFIVSAENYLNLSGINGPKQLIIASDEEVMAPKKLVKRYLAFLNKKTPLKPYLFIATGRNFKNIDSYANPKYFKFSKIGKYVAKKILKNLSKIDGKLDSNRFKNIFSSVFGWQCKISLRPEKINMIFTTKHNGDRIYIYYKFWTNKLTKESLGGYLVAFSEQDLNPEKIINWAVDIERKNSKIDIVIKKPKDSTQPIIKGNLVTTYFPIPFSIMKLNVFSGRDLARIFSNKEKFETSYKKVANAELCSYPFFSVSRRVKPVYSRSFTTFASLFSLLLSFVSLYIVKNVSGLRKVTFSIRHKLFLSLIIASVLPLLLMTYFAMKYSNASVRNELNKSSKMLAAYLKEVGLEVNKFENKQTMKIYDLMTDLKRVVNRDKKEINSVIDRYLVGSMRGIYFFRTDGEFILRKKGDNVSSSIIRQVFLALCLEGLKILGYDFDTARANVSESKILKRNYNKLISASDCDSFLRSRGKVFNIRLGRKNNIRTVSYSTFPKIGNGKGFFLSVSQDYEILAEKFIQNNFLSFRTKEMENLPGYVDTKFFIFRKSAAGTKNLSVPKSVNTNVDNEAMRLASQFINGKIDDFLMKRKNGIDNIWRFSSYGVFPLIAVTHFSADKIPMIKFYHKILIFFLYVYAFLTLSLITQTLSIEFIRSIELLLDGLKRISNGSFPQIYADIKNEFSTIISMFNDMSKGLKERNSLERFVSSEATKAITEEGFENRQKMGEKVTKTILFAHVKDFKILVGKSSPEDLIKLLNIYFTEVEKIVIDHSGSIDKYIGDAVMAVFDDEKNACRAALEISYRVNIVNEMLDANNLINIEIGIGIAGGKVISGRVGAHGSRMDFTVVGDRVNLAARLESLSRRNENLQILVSEEVFLQSSKAFKFEKYGSVTVKGKTEQVMSYILKNELK